MKRQMIIDDDEGDMKIVVPKLPLRERLLREPYYIQKLEEYQARLHEIHRRKCEINRPVVDNTWTIERLAREDVPVSWESVFAETEDMFPCISRLVAEKGPIAPSVANIFRAFHLTPLPAVRVVFVLQDPYYSLYSDGSCIATGLALSTAKNRPIQPTLLNIYKELEDTYTEFKRPIHGSLETWAENGVLLLNTSLTVRVNDAGSHSKLGIWNGLLENVFSAIAKEHPNCVYVLFGRDAQTVKNMIKGNIIESVHPSPLSAHKGFFGANLFKKIDWYLNVRNATKPKGNDHYHIDYLLEKMNWNIEN